MLRLVTEPAARLAESSRNPSLVQVAGFVVLAGLVFSLEAVVVYHYLDPRMASDIGRIELRVTIVLFAVARFFEPVVVWLVGAFVLVVITRFAHGRIYYTNALHAVAWGFPALVLAGIVRVLSFYITLGDAPQPVGPEPHYRYPSPSIFAGIYRYNELIAHVATDPVHLYFVGGTVVCFLWAGYIWMHGLEQFGTELDRREAAPAAGVLVLLLLIWQIV